MTETHSISKMAEKLLKEKNKTLKDVKLEFERKKKELENKQYITETQPWTSSEPKRVKRKLGRPPVTLIQSNFPFKMFVLQEAFIEGEQEPEIRLGYYIISPKTLKEKGELRLVWGQYNPNIPKKDLIELLKKANEKGVIDMNALST